MGEDGLRDKHTGEMLLLLEMDTSAECKLRAMKRVVVKMSPRTRQTVSESVNRTCRWRCERRCVSRGIGAHCEVAQTALRDSMTR
jgi:hypothetical protein